MSEQLKESPRITWARASIEARDNYLREAPNVDSDFLEKIAMNAWEAGRVWMINNPCPGLHAAPGAPQQEASGDAAAAYLGAALREQAVYLSRETVRTLVDGVLSRAAATAPARYFGPAAESAVEILRSMGYEYQQTSNGLAWVSTAPTGGTALQALDALDELESSARGDEPFNHHAAPLVRQFIESTIATAPAGGVTEADVRKVARKVMEVCEGWQNSTYSWQGNEPGAFEKAQATHADECERRLLPVLAALATAARAAEPETYRVFKDGNQWCAVGPAFTNLQESSAGFADTPYLALERLTEAEAEEKRKAWRAASPTPPTGTSKGEGTS